MGLEIERKFLLGDPSVLLGRQGVRMLQAYIAQGAVLVRVRAQDDAAWLTLKGREHSALSRPEWEYPIPLQDAQALASQPGAYGLEKTRFYLDHKGLTYELDAYHGALEGLYTVEVELEHEDQPIDLPDWVGEELTGRPEWSNEQLARKGKPFAGSHNAPAG